MSRIPLPVGITLLPGPAALLEASSDDRPGGSYGRGAGAWVFQGGKRLRFRVEELGAVSCCLFLDPTLFPSLLRCWWKPWSGSVPLCAVRTSPWTYLSVPMVPGCALQCVRPWMRTLLFGLDLELGLPLETALSSSLRWVSLCSVFDSALT